MGNIDELVAPLCKENPPQEERQVAIQETARDAASQPLVSSGDGKSFLEVRGYSRYRREI